MMEKLTRILEDCTQEEREAAMLLFKAAENREQSEAVLILVRKGRKREVRARYEVGGEKGGRRTLPARLPAGLAALYEETAHRRGLTTYAWVREAFERQWQHDNPGTGMAATLRAAGRDARDDLKNLMAAAR